MPIPGLSTITSSVTGAVNNVTGAVNAATSAVGGVVNGVNNSISKLSGALQGGVDKIASSIRSIGIPSGAETQGGGAGAAAYFGSSDVKNDWRVRLSVPDVFSSSDALKPLKATGGMVFPYTPTIQLTHTANYADVGVTHQNYQFTAYENSRVDQITISAPFNVEDGQQATYWIAALHYFRSVTKMFTGEDKNAGNPPVIVKFNAYGEYVFNNVPVVVKSFSFDLPQDSNYIPADANYVASLATGAIGAFGGSTAGNVAGLLGGLLGSGIEKSRVPTKSTLNVVLQPVYSREAARYFSLEKFVKGEYVKGTGGYV